MPFGPSQFRVREMETEYEALKNLCAANRMQWWDEFLPCYTWLYGSGLPNQYYSRDFVHSGELGKQIIGRVMLRYFLTGKSGKTGQASFPQMTER